MKKNITHFFKSISWWSKSINILAPGFFLVFFTTTVEAQTNLTVGPVVGTTTISGPSSTTLTGQRYERHTAIYSATELSTAGLSLGQPVIGIAWEKTGTASYLGGDLEVRIWLRHFTATTFPTNPLFDTMVTPATLVYSTTTGTIPSAPGWLQFDFNTSNTFVWNGTNHVQVITEIYRPTSWTTTGFSWRTTTAVTNSTANQNAATPPVTAMTRTATRPQIQLVVPAAGTEVAILDILPPTSTSPGPNTLEVVIRNLGTNTITSGTINWSLNGGPSTAYNWTGSLLPGQSETVLIATPTYTTGNKNISVTINFPGDANSANNTISESFIICNPLSGTYTIHPTTGDFTSLNDLAYILENCGVSGNVTVNVVAASGPYVEQVVFNPYTGMGTSSVTLNGNGNTVTFTTDATNRFIIRLTDVSNFTINNFNIVRDATALSGFMGIHIFNSGSNIAINNVNIDMAGSTSTLVGGIIASGSETSFLTGGTYSNITVTNNTTTDGGYGVVLYGLTASSVTGSVIQRNTIINSFSNGIYVHTTSALNTDSNQVQIGAGNGIQIAGTANLNASVQRNTITANNPTTTGILRGIYNFGGTGHRIFNNIIWNLNAPAASIVGLSTRSSAEFYFNTVILDDATATGNVSIGFEEDASNTASVFRNNILYVTRTSSNYSAGIGLNSASTVTTAITSNNNVFWVPVGYVAVRKGTSFTAAPTNIYTNLSDWQGASGQDANSFQSDPFFQAGTARPTSGVINDGAVAITGITTDITGTTRALAPATAPDPGAFEFSPPMNDAATTAFVPPALPVCGNSINVQFELTNAGLATLTSAVINWQVNGANQPVYNWSGSLAPGASTTVTLGSATVTGNNIYNFTATASLPNGVTDQNPANNSFTYNGLRRGMSGTFTINQSAGVSATNYQTFQSIANDLSLYGVCGNVTINVMNGPYTEQVVFNTIPGSASNRTVTLIGNGQELNFNPTVSSNDHILRLDAVTYFTVQGLSVKSTNASNGRGIFITNGSSKILLQNNTVEVSTTNTSSTTFPIIASGTNYLLDGAGADSLAIFNNTVIGGYVGIQISGTNAVPVTNVAINGNQVRDQHTHAIQSSAVTYVIISGNVITRPARTGGSGSFYAINITFNTNNFLVEKNRIHSLQNAGMTLSHLSAGIKIDGTATAPSTGNIENNLIYGMTNTSTQYGIVDATWGPGSLINIYHNTIALDDAAFAGSATTSALQLSTTQTNTGQHNIRNNILYLSRGGTGTKRLIDVASASTTFTSNYNVFYFGTTAGTRQVGRVATILYADISDWQASGRDVNGVYADPQFDMNYVPTNPFVDGGNMGTVSVGVLTDINNMSRTTNPDPGAFEWVACILGTWTGAVSTDWNTAGNWCGNIIPTATIHVTIPDVSGTTGNFPVVPVVGGAAVDANSLTILSGANVTILQGAIIDVRGNVVNTGNQNVGLGELRFTGASAQTISGSVTVGIFRVENTNGVSLTGTSIVRVTEALLLETGILTVPGTASVILRSTPTITAYLDDFSAGFTGTYAGNITVERIVVNPYAGFHYVGSPVSGINVNQWADDFSLATNSFGGNGIQVIPQANCAQDSLEGKSPYGGLFDYRENTVTFCNLEGWHVRNAGAATPGQGFAGIIPNGRTLDVTGAPSTGAVSYGPLTNTLSNPTASRGFNLVANPYPSPINWGDVYSTNSANLDADAHIWVSTGYYGGNYQTIVPGVSPASEIASSQAFFVFVSNPGSTNINFNNTHRRTGNAAFLKEAKIWEHILNIDIAGNGFADKTTVYFTAEPATPLRDARYDGRKLKGRTGQPQIYTMTTAADKLSINGQPLIGYDEFMVLAFEAGASGTFTFSFNDVESFPSTAFVYLEDTKTGEMVNLRVQDSYTFTATPLDDVNRFVLHFTPPIEVTTADAGCEINSGMITLDQPGTTEWNYSVVTDGGDVVAAGKDFNGATSSTNVAAGTYTLNLTHSSGYSVSQIIEIDGGVPVTADFTQDQDMIFPNEPVVFISNSTGATTYEWSFGDGKATMFDLTTVPYVFAEEGIYTITLKAANDDCMSTTSKEVTVYAEKVSSVTTATEGTMNVYGRDNTIRMEWNGIELNQAQVLVYNVAGQLVANLQVISGSGGQVTIEVPQTDGSMYFVRVIDGETVNRQFKVFISK